MIQNVKFFMTATVLFCTESFKKVIGLSFSKLSFKGGLLWKNDLGLYSSLVLLMNIGMDDLVILRLV